MSSLQQLYIAGSSAGLQTDKKPFLLPEQAYVKLFNAYVWRDRVIKREGLEILGRLRLVLLTQAQANADGTTTYTIADILAAFRALEPNAELEAGKVVLTFDPGGGSQTIFTDNGLGGFTRTSGVAYQITSPSVVNYITGAITLTFVGGSEPGAGITVSADFNYFPSLPVMGIDNREVPTINFEETIIFDTRYAYHFVGTGFQEFLPGTTWSGSDSDFFWTTNYRGITPNIRIFFATNNVVNANNPMRYSTGSGNWIDFIPILAQPPESITKTYLVQARILIPYYGRLVALNVWEAPDDGFGNPNYASAVNIFNRAEYSQIGNPLDTVVPSPVVDRAWRRDIFGRGGFVDAPTNEAIVGATFFKNTLIVRFERSTWQLRYQGEYGIPFIWERISGDFGSESTFSDVLFDQGVLSVGDKAITSATSIATNRIDLQIPDAVFGFRNEDEGRERIQGIRDFQKELVYWCYCDPNMQGIYPQQTLVYNYRNNTYAIFRNSITTLGTFQTITGVTWDSLDVDWDDDEITWDTADDQSLFPKIISGNQQGFVHYYGYQTIDDPSLSISNINMTITPNRLTIVNHNLQDLETIYLSGIVFDSVPDVDLNGRLYNVNVLTKDVISISYYDGTLVPPQYVDTPIQTNRTYLGNGKVTLFPVMEIQTKDFNPYVEQGSQLKISYVDFLTDASENALVTINLYASTAVNEKANLLVGNKAVETYNATPYYLPGSNYAWHRFFATSTGQFIRVEITYDDELMNNLNTHQQDFVLNAISLWIRPGSRNVF
jgi:hypothetical protein